MRYCDTKEKPRLSASVLDIVSAAVAGGDLHSAAYTRRRIAEGIDAHRTVQDSWPVEYEREVAVELTVERPNAVITVRGRIDGVIENDEGFLVEEIKSIEESPADVSPGIRRRHLAQAKLYAYIIAVLKALSTISVRLTYYRTKTHETTFVDHVCSFQELEGHFFELTDEYIHLIQRDRQRRRERNQFLKGIKFPFKRIRQGQAEFIEHVANGIANASNVFLCAPTGIGKTAAALFPALKAMADGCCENIFYLTARTTTQRVAEETLGRISGQSAKLRSVTITAKEKACPFKRRFCVPEKCELAKGYFERLPLAIDESAAASLFTRDRIADLAARHRICPFELSLDMALTSDCIICDYNYLFDPRIYLRRFFAADTSPAPAETGIPSRPVFLIDEAHNLVDRARDMYSAAIDKKRVLECKRSLNAKRFPVLSRQLKSLNDYLLSLKKFCIEQDVRYYAAEQLSEEVFEIAEDIVQSMQAVLLETPDLVFELYIDLIGFLVIHGLQDDSHASTIEINKSSLVLKLVCLDPSQFVRKCIERGRSGIFFSATLVPEQYFISLLGGKEDEDDYIILPSPFPERNRNVMLVDTISTRYNQRQGTYSLVADYIDAFTVRDGNYLVFFPSFEYMERVSAAGSSFSKDKRILCQKRQMAENERQKFLEHFTDSEREGSAIGVGSTDDFLGDYAGDVALPQDVLIGFAVVGGIFSEGIDLPGERLIGVIVVGVGLPAVTFERELMKRYFDERQAEGFHYTYTFPALNKILQAAGRLIRSETDRGVMLFIGERYSKMPYANLLDSLHSRIDSAASPEAVRGLVESFWSGPAD